VFLAQDATYRNEVPRGTPSASPSIGRCGARGIRCPLLMIIGTEDNITSPAAQRRGPGSPVPSSSSCLAGTSDAFRAAATLPEVNELSFAFPARADRL